MFEVDELMTTNFKICVRVIIPKENKNSFTNEDTSEDNYCYSPIISHNGEHQNVSNDKTDCVESTCS